MNVTKKFRCRILWKQKCKISKYTSMSYKFYETLERWSKYTHYVTLHIAETIDMDVSIDYSRFFKI